MKKLTIIVLTVIGLAIASYADNINNTQLIGNGNDTETIEKAKPHTQQYKDLKKIMDEYGQEVKQATTCEDLEDASMSFLLKLLSTAGTDYDEDMTPEEEKELDEQMNSIDNRVSALQEQWNCETEDDSDLDEGEDEDIEMIETSTEEWENMINELDAIVTRMEKMQHLDFKKDENIDRLMEVVMPLQRISEKMELSSVDNITDKQTQRLEQINNRLVIVAAAIGLIDEDDN